MLGMTSPGCVSSHPWPSCSPHRLSYWDDTKAPSIGQMHASSTVQAKWLWLLWTKSLQDQRGQMMHHLKVGMQWPPLPSYHRWHNLLSFVMWYSFISPCPSHPREKVPFISSSHALTFPPYGLPHLKITKLIYRCKITHTHTHARTHTPTHIYTWQYKTLGHNSQGCSSFAIAGGKEKAGVGQRKRSSLRRGRHYLPLGLVYDTACKYAREKSILRHTWDRLREAICGEDGEKGCCRMLLFGGAALVFLAMSKCGGVRLMYIWFTLFYSFIYLLQRSGSLHPCK